MFFTGTFKFENGIINTCQRCHDKEEYDDDPFHGGLLEDPDGFVTNKGNEITIHIKPDVISRKNINSVKEAFSLYDDRLHIKTCSAKC